MSLFTSAPQRTTLAQAARQALLILLVSAVVAVAANAVRTDGLPLFGGGGARTGDPATGEISLADAAMLFAAGRAVFLDARSAFEYDLGHIKGALSLPVEDYWHAFDRYKPRFGEGLTVITYCDGERCPLGHELAERLRAEGIAEVYELKNGWSLWKAQGLPTESGGAPDFLTNQPNLCTVCGDDK